MVVTDGADLLALSRVSLALHRNLHSRQLELITFTTYYDITHYASDMR